MARQRVSIRLEPLGRTVGLESGASLREALFPFGVEFPCGGRGQCRKCRVKVLSGWLPISAADSRLFSPDELEEGWRLACHAQADAALTLEIGQMEAPILGDDSAFEFQPRPGLGVAIDVGTTTLVAQLVDLSTGRVLAVRSALNPQAMHGADIMSRVEVALDGGAQKLQNLARQRVGEMLDSLVRGGRVESGAIHRVVLAGNTVMHHLFCGIDAEPLSHVPFEPVDAGLKCFRAQDLGWTAAPRADIAFLPCLGGFVGSDILSGILATRLHENPTLTGLIDLGTNGEVVFGAGGRIICASTAAGPAFEGGRISQGMRAATGAISDVLVENGALKPHVIGGGVARGICGSGLVDAVAGGLEVGLILPNGRLPAGQLDIAPGIALTQGDIRELQLAKGAIAAGVRVILDRFGAAAEDVERVYLAGAFGNYVTLASARAIGLMRFPEERIQQAGNTALLGAKLALFSDGLEFADLRGTIEHISLASDPHFHEIYAEEMSFPVDGR